MLRTAFIGAGGRARSAHYPTVTTLADVRVEAVCELDAALMAQVAEQYAIPQTFADYRRMLDEVDLDLIYVIMGEEFMAPIAIDCMNAGKHVFIEKPAGANPEESRALLAAAQANGVSCAVGYQRRFAAVTVEAMRLVRERGGPTLAVGEFPQEPARPVQAAAHDHVAGHLSRGRSGPVPGRQRGGRGDGLPGRARLGLDQRLHLADALRERHHRGRAGNRSSGDARSRASCTASAWAAPSGFPTSSRYWSRAASRAPSTVPTWRAYRRTILAPTTAPLRCTVTWPPRSATAARRSTTFATWCTPPIWWRAWKATQPPSRAPGTDEADA